MDQRRVIRRYWLSLFGVCCDGDAERAIGRGCCLAIWAFCRAYYFAFYVIENYIDPKFRFAGLLSVLGYFVDKDKVVKTETAQDSERKDANDRKDMVLANAHQAWLAIAILIVL
jgi:hypothetical protein